jgi:hypothetical protein
VGAPFAPADACVEKAQQGRSLTRFSGRQSHLKKSKRRAKFNEAAALISPSNG